MTIKCPKCDTDKGLNLCLQNRYSRTNPGEGKRLDWLSRAVDHGDINYPFLNENNPLLENIRGDSRFKKLMERVKREWENFEM